MSDNKVEYVLTLQDLLSGKIHQADESTKHFQETIKETQEKAHGLGERFAHVFENIGIGFALFKGAEFVKGSVEQFRELQDANAQIKAGLESTGSAAGLTFNELTEQAEKFSHSLKFDDADIKKMQSVLLTFPSVAKETFGGASEAILNMSTRLGTDLQGSAIQVGKALQDPVQGLTALKRVGVNFSDSQKEMIGNFVETGQKAKAQQLILKELQTEFGGSAEAAAAADPLFRFNKTIEETKDALGEAVVSLQTAFQPALIVFGDAIRDAANGVVRFVNYLKEGSAGARVIRVALGVLVGGIAAYTVMTAGAAIATGVFNAALAVMTAIAEANPIGLIVIGVAALAAGVYAAYQNFQQFRSVLAGIGEIASELWAIFKGLGETIGGLFMHDFSLIKKGISDAVNATKEFSNRGGVVGAFAIGYAKNEKKENQESALHRAVDPKKQGGKIGLSAPGKSLAEKKESVTGQKVYTINIKIDSLIKDFKISTTNLSESASKIRDAVSSALKSAVNDSQIIAGA